MIPIRDINPTQRFPIATVALIAVNVLVFIYQASLGTQRETLFVMEYAVRPAELLRDFNGQAQTLVTSMFLHGDILHIGSNMLYLWIFGNNIEDQLGIPRFLLFYFLTGFIAGGAQIAIDPSSQIPMIGASGAIAGVLGGYLILFPRAKVQTIILLFYFIRVVEISAMWLLGWWFVIQLFGGVSALGIESQGGVAFFAHIGGFVGGLILIRIFTAGRAIERRPIDNPVDGMFRRPSNDPWTKALDDDFAEPPPPRDDELF